MAEGRAAKLRRLDGFRRRVPYISASALDAVFREIEAHGIPDIHDRKSMNQARDMIAKSDTPHGDGPIHQKIQLQSANGPLTMEIAHPLAMLWHCFGNCDAWALVAGPLHGRSDARRGLGAPAHSEVAGMLLQLLGAWPRSSGERGCLVLRDGAAERRGSAS